MISLQEILPAKVGILAVELSVTRLPHYLHTTLLGFNAVSQLVWMQPKAALVIKFYLINFSSLFSYLWQESEKLQTSEKQNINMN